MLGFKRSTNRYYYEPLVYIQYCTDLSITDCRHMVISEYVMTVECQYDDTLDVQYGNIYNFSQ